MSRLPLVLLDVDGALLTYADPENDISDPRVDWQPWDREGGVRYNPAMPGWIHELHELAELRWATGWGTKARTVLAPALGLPDFEVDEAADFQKPGIDFKETIVARHLGAGRRVVWIEDDIPDGRRNDVLHRMGREGAGLLMVRTTLDDGLTEAHMLRIRAFLAAGSVATPGSIREGRRWTGQTAELIWQKNDTDKTELTGGNHMDDLSEKLRSASLNLHVGGLDKVGSDTFEALCREAARELHRRGGAGVIFAVDKLCRRAVLGIEDGEGSDYDLLQEAAAALENA